MVRFFVLAYGVMVYLIFVATMLYAVGFVSGFVVPKTIDNGTPAARPWAIAIDVGLLALFAVQHTIMARPAFKRWWTQLIPQSVERSTFVLFASLTFVLLFSQWQPLPDEIWRAPQPLALVLSGLSLVGWGLVVYTTFVIDHLELFGLRQVYFAFSGREMPPSEFVERAVYRWVRHPLMLGFLIAIWPAATMTYGHALFSTITTAYIFFGVHLEERDLCESLGEAYVDYRQRTPMFIPGLRFRRAQ